MARNISISLGNHFEHFIENMVNTDRFNNVSEVVRAGLRLLEEEENKLITLKNAIDEGARSGYVSDFDPALHLENLKRKRNSND